MFYNAGNISLTLNFKHFDFIELFESNYKFNGLFEILSIKEFLVDFLVIFLIDLIMRLSILPISTQISKSF